MNESFLKIKNYIIELGYSIDHENEEDGVFVVSSGSDGIQSLVIGIAEPILIIEQFLFEMSSDNMDTYKQLLQKNRDIIHGAFVLDDSGNKVIFRDTLQIENLDLNELEGTFNSLAVLLGEYTDEIIDFSKR
jgi:hypothetical protein